MKDFKGKVAVITGGASGIGKAMAERFAKAEMKLTLVDIEEGPLEATAEALRKGGADVLTQRVDVSSAEAMDQLGETVVEHFGAVHVVCNNAGVAAAGPVWDLSVADWEFTFGANLWGVIHGVRVFSKYLIDQDEGHFVNTASLAGLVSAPSMGAYNVTKQGVVALSETLFADLQLAGSKVGVSVLCPGFVQTQIWNSERNRPDHLQNAEKKQDDGQTAFMQDVIRKTIESAMPTEKIAERVFDAIVRERLYIITHEATAPILNERIRVILNDENPKITLSNPADMAK